MAGGGPNYGVILGNPFLLGMIVFSVVSFLITFICLAIVGRVTGGDQLGFYVALSFAILTWWIWHLHAIGSVDAYRQLLLAILAYFSVLTTLYVSFFGSSAAIGAGVGFLFMTIILFVWVIYLASPPESLAIQLIGGGGLGGNKRNNDNRRSAGGPATISGPIGVPQGNLGGGVSPGASSPGAQLATPFKATALYAYEANPADPAEISFSKDEILDIVDNTSRWWHVVRADGQKGIAPSNYLEPLGSIRHHTAPIAEPATPDK